MIMSVVPHRRLIKTYKEKNNKDLIFIELGGGAQSIDLYIAAFLDDVHCKTEVAARGALSPCPRASVGRRKWPTVAREKKVAN